MSSVPRVFRNDWSSVAVPDLADWQPTLTVSVVIPAYEDQATLDLTLAALSRQTYPDELLEVIVIDDGSDPPLQLPDIRPVRTTLLRVTDGWGKSNALRLGVAHASGEILHLLDADMLLYPEHIAAQARWHHAVPYAATLGVKRFVDPEVHHPWPTPDSVVQAWSTGAAERLFGGSPGDPHDYQERYISQTEQLRAADHLAFRIFVGMTVAMRRELYEAAGGPDPVMRFGNDTELGYRLAQAGAVFVPEPLARSWHLGPTHVMLAQDEIARYRLALIADLVPFPRHWRKAGGSAWTVPLVEVTMTVGDEPLERVRAAVDSVLRGTVNDVRVSLVGPWNRLATGRVPALTDPQLEPRLIAATYRGEPRVRLVAQVPASAFPSPYLLELSPGYGLAPDSLRHLIDLADGRRAGVVRIAAEDRSDAVATLWRTSAVSRARCVMHDGESLLDAVASVHGRRDAGAEEVGMVNLSAFEPRQLAGGSPRLARRGRRRAGPVTSTVEVEGVRSLARAAMMVARLGSRRVVAGLRSATGRNAHVDTEAGRG